VNDYLIGSPRIYDEAQPRPPVCFLGYTFLVIANKLSHFVEDTWHYASAVLFRDWLV
jgi:hypothetical protein